MVPDPDFFLTLASALCGLVITVAMEHLLQPRPKLARPRRAWGVHAGIWFIGHAAFTLGLARPWFACATVLALLFILVMVNNAKMKALREPFVFQDYEYFTDAIRHPRLYIPFLGWWKFSGAVAGVAAAILIGFMGEAAPENPFSLHGQLLAIFAEVGLGGGLLIWGARRSLLVTFNPVQDILRLGFIACLWRYAEEERQPLAACSPFDGGGNWSDKEKLPHLIAVQSESFFDARSLYSGIRNDILAGFDRLKSEATYHGRLQVPAWGANTVRSEFAFLSGIRDSQLGVHRFNPYRVIASGQTLPSLASFLRENGYQTVCIHPYPGSFYRRDFVMPKQGFDQFLDISAFDKNLTFGPYISDAAVASKISEIVRDATRPVFVFAITMENHGPLHLEQVSSADIAQLYSAPPPAGCDDLTVYLRHLRNADRMAVQLHTLLSDLNCPASLCWFGDHVPIMPDVYKKFGVPNGEVEYLLWHNKAVKETAAVDLDVSELAVQWLKSWK